MSKSNNNIKIYDLGNLKITDSINDTYFAVRDLILELTERGIVTVILGGSQDISKGVFLAYEKLKGLHTVLTIDSRLDFSLQKEVTNSRNYLNYIISEKKKNLFNYSNIGHQAYFVTDPQFEKLDKSYLESVLKYTWFGYCLINPF